MNSSWGCPHEIDGKCARVNNMPCNPGMKGCVLFGRFIWADATKNRPAKNGHGDAQTGDKPADAAIPVDTTQKNQDDPP
jgi:hypothetical protein